MSYEVGDIIEGSVSKITRFGVFLDLPDGKRGLVHISEIANTYVNDIKEHLRENDKVKAKVLTINSDGKLDLSIKKALSTDQDQNSKQKFFRDSREKRTNATERKSSVVLPPQTMTPFELKLASFLKANEDRLANLRRSIESKRGVEKHKI